MGLPFKSIAIQDSYKELLELLLPAVLLSYFEVKKIDKKEKVMHLYLEKINNILTEYAHYILQSKGFYDSITVQDIPIRGYQV